ncbi:MAG: hypothetical protein HY315_04480 [Acidobacteria bacterium]|nr:hypothetical protein [Acidobacteriota bacterium]
MKRKVLTVGIFIGLALVIFYLGPFRNKPADDQTYAAPRYPSHAYSQQTVTEDQLRSLARNAVRSVEGETPLGKVGPGEKVLLEIRPQQDMRLLKAIIEAYKDRQIEADYVYDYDMVAQALGISREEAYAKKIISKGPFGEGARGPRDGYIEALSFPSILPEQLQKEAAELRQNRVFILGDEVGARESGTAYRSAMRKYVMELHPEYDAVFGGRPLRIYTAAEVGPKWKGYFSYGDLKEMQSFFADKFPTDVWRLIVERTVEVIPWVEQARNTDPQGTDLRFSLTQEQAELWSKGTYHVGQVYLYPLQGTRLLYLTEGRKEEVVPEAEGIIAGTSNHNGFYPLVKVYVSKGKVDRVEGGGRMGEIMRAILANEKVKNLHYPYLPYPGFFYVCEGVPGTNPKGFRYYEAPGNVVELSRSGVFRFGFGVGSLAPEFEEYAKKNNVPNAHGFHVHQYFMTYEVKTRGTDRRFKIIDRGRMTALDDPEVKALSSRYGSAEDLLKEDWIPAIPGINVKGDFQKDYADDPFAYVQKEVEEVRKGTYKYLTP